MMNNENNKLDNMRILPHNVEAEHSILGALMLNNENLDGVDEILQPYHFHIPVHGKIYEAICILISQGLEASPVTLKPYFEKNDELRSVEGGNYLVQLVNSVVSIISAKDYAKIVRDFYIRRKLILHAESVIQKASTNSLDTNADDQIEEAEATLYELSNSNNRSSGVFEFNESLSSTVDMMKKARESGKNITGVTTGFLDIDKTLGGLNKTNLIILAGRPSMGKTALATNISYNAALSAMKDMEGGGKVVFFSLEMSKEEICNRILSQECGISSDKTMQGKTNSDEFEKILLEQRKISKAPLRIDETPALTIASIRTRARRIKRKHGLDLIVVDYLQLIQGSINKRNENRVQEVSEITRGLKAIAKELDVPVLALSQLSRGVEGREEKRPQLSDLRDSGAIEQDADIVMFVYREEYYEERKKPNEDTEPEKYSRWLDKMNKIHNKAEIIIAKNRHGAIGTVELHFKSDFAKFENSARR